MKKTGAQILWESLVREGVTCVFGYPGGAILPAYDAMLDYPIRHILVRHEQGATHMADGYARATGQVGVAIATSGPGRDQHGHRHRHRDDGLLADRLHHRPGRQQADRSDAFQETDITGITLPVTKHNYLVTRADDVARVVREAFYVARSGRPGPVLIDITKDAQQSSCEFDWPEAPKLRGYRPDHRADRARGPARPRPDPLGQAPGHPRRPRHHRSRGRCDIVRAVRRAHATSRWR